jgi:hypothetical protein
MKINFRQGVVSYQSTGFLEPNGSGGVRIAASTRSTTVTIAHRDTNYTHSEDNNVENAWAGPFPAGDNYYLYWDFDQLTFARTFGYTTLEPIAQSVPPGHGNSPIVAATPGVASPVAYGSFEVEGRYSLPAGRTIAVVGSTGSPNNDGVYTVQSTSYDSVTGNTTISVNEAVATATVSGELTLDIDSKGLPLFVTGRHWFDTANNIHYVLDASNNWIEVIRVFAAELRNGTTFISLSQTGEFSGTQIGNNSAIASGRVLFGETGNPIRRDDNTFFTTEDQFFTNQSRVDAIRLESNVSRAQAYSSSLAQFGIVAWRADGKIASATYSDTGNTVVGVLTEDLLVGQVGAVITQGTVTNPSWNWTATLDVGSKLWIEDGQLVGTNPHVSSPGIYPEPHVAVARVLSVDTVIFEQGLGGVGPQGPVGTLEELPLATTSDLGAVYLSHAATNPLLPIAVGENHPVITGGPYAAASHSHTALQTSFTPGNDISSSDVQNAIAELAIEKLNLAGGTMSGFLTLNAAPSNDFHATTKAYVDALFQGIDAKEACLVGTTTDFGGLYSSIGGTGGTGAITGALISSLDGTIDVDFALAIGTRILVKDQTDDYENGIYVVTAIGAGSPPTTVDVERSSDFDSNDEIRAGNYTVLSSGLTQAGQGWVLTDIHPEDDIELNNHPITWTLVSSATTYLGDPNTINIDGSNTISVIPASTGGQVDALKWNTTSLTTAGAADGKTLVYNSGSVAYEPSQFTLPAATGAATEVLTSDGVGGTYWASGGGNQTPWLSNIDTNGYGTYTQSVVGSSPAIDGIGVNFSTGATDKIYNAHSLPTNNIVLNGGNTATGYTAGAGWGDFSYGRGGNIVLQPGVNTAIDNYVGTYIPYRHGMVEIRGYDSYPATAHARIGTAPPVAGDSSPVDMILSSGGEYKELGFQALGNLRVEAGYNIGSGQGSNLYMSAGSSGRSDGGTVTLYAGHGAKGPYGAYGSSTYGGSVKIHAGNTYGRNGHAGNIEIYGGSNQSASSGSGYAGSVRIKTKGFPTGTGYYSGSYGSGNIVVWAGDGESRGISNADGAFIKLIAGYGGTDGGLEGTIQIRGTGYSGEAKLDMYDDAGTNKRVRIQVPSSLAADTLFQLPPDNGGSGYVLTSNGSGVTTWTASSSNNWLIANNGADFSPTAPTATGSNAITIGHAAKANGNDSIAFGTNAYAEQTNGIAVGLDSHARANSVVIGNNAQSYSTGGAVVIGLNAAAPVGTSAPIAIGKDSDAAANCIAIGETAQATVSAQAMAIGRNSNSNGQYSLALGHNAYANSSTTGRAIAIGYLAQSDHDYETVIGNQLHLITSYDHAVLIGSGAAGVNQNYLHLHSKGKFYIEGDEAQVVMPNHPTATLAGSPQMGVSGGTVFDTNTSTLKYYNGSQWNELADADAPVTNKPSYEKITLGGSPVSQVLTTNVTVAALTGSPIQTASIQVFRNGMLQNEDATGGSPIDGDFQVTGANELTFAPDVLQPNGVIIIYVFN